MQRFYKIGDNFSSMRTDCSFKQEKIFCQIKTKIGDVLSCLQINEKGTVSDIDLNQSIIVGSFRNTNH